MSDYRTTLDEALDFIMETYEKKSGEKVLPEERLVLAEETIDRVLGFLHTLSAYLKPNQQYFLTTKEGKLETKVFDSLSSRMQFIYFGPPEKMTFDAGIVSVLEHMTEMVGPRQKPLIRDAQLVVIDGKIALLGLKKEKREPLIPPRPPGWKRATVVKYGAK